MWPSEPADLEVAVTSVVAVTTGHVVHGGVVSVVRV